MTRIALLGAAIALLAPAGASAKEISAAKVCGASECREVKDRDLAMALVGGGPPAEPPKPDGRWYRATFTVRAEDGEDVFIDHFSMVVAPLSQRMLGEDGSWMAMPAETADAYAKVTSGIEPRPARTLPGVGADAREPAARVDEVFAPAASPAVAATDDSHAWIVPLGAALAAACGIVLVALLRRRRRRGASPHQGRASAA